MNQHKMQKLLGLLITVILIAALPLTAYAAKPVKASKERVVLMPLRVAEEDKSLQGAMETALVEGLQQKYEVFSGEQVAQKARQIFMKESHSAKKECDETRCMQGIAEAFQAELIATANVTKQDGGYFLALSIQNIFDNKVVYSKSMPCKGCDTFQMVDKLKELVGTLSPVTTAQVAEEAQPKVNQNDPDAVLWTEAQKGNRADDYQVYIDTYPKGKYIPFAKARIKKFKEVVQTAIDQQEQQAWEAAQQESSEASYSHHLKAYPAGRYFAAASAKLKLIKEEEAKGPAMVRIPGKKYEMGKYEVTQIEWRDIMGNNPSGFNNCGDTCPVEQVSWNDVQEYLQKLNAKTGRQYRLPTEVEWEYACYGGRQTEYCGSNDIDSVAWYNNNSDKKTHLTGQKEANDYGLFDMSGNVSEWMSDCYKGDCAKRMLRGSSWYWYRLDARAAGFDFRKVVDRNNDNGFRLARTLP